MKEFIYLILIFVLRIMLVALFLAIPVELLWNWVIVAIWGMKTISYFKAWGLISFVFLFTFNLNEEQK